MDEEALWTALNLQRPANWSPSTHIRRNSWHGSVFNEHQPGIRTIKCLACYTCEIITGQTGKGTWYGCVAQTTAS